MTPILDQAQVGYTPIYIYNNTPGVYPPCAWTKHAADLNDAA